MTTNDTNDKKLKFFCREMITGHGYTGRLSISDKKMKLRLLSFDAKFGLSSEQSVPVVLDDGRIATLMECIHFGPGYARSHERTVWKATIIPNTVLIGPDVWNASNPVRSTIFRFTESEVALLVPKAIDRRSEPSAVRENAAQDDQSASRRHIWIVDDSERSILKVRTDEMSIEIWSALSYSLGSQRDSIDLTPTVTIDFHGTVSIDEYLLAVCDLVSLFSISIGYASRPIDIHVSPCTTDERIREMRQGTFRGDFEACYTWESKPPKSDRLWAGSSVLQVLDLTERSATEESLVTWLNRRRVWQAAYGLMNRSLKRRTDMDGERLRSAITWFENIPLNQPSLRTDQVSAVADAAIAEAGVLGLRAIDDRIEQRLRSVISQLTKESPSQRFMRLIPAIRDRFGRDLVPDRLERDCKNAVDLRGKATHATLAGDERAFIELSRAVYAVEMVAFLLTIRDLPIAEAATSRLRLHPFMQYLQFYPPQAER